MARMYRAGTAFVQVVPSFKGMQKDIARHFRESLRKELSNKDTFKGLEQNLERAFQNGIKNASKETRKQIQLAVEALERDSAKAGRVVNKNLREATKDIGGAFEADVRKAGANLRKAMGEQFGKNLPKELHEARAQIRKDMDLLGKAYKEGGVQNEREIRRAYNRLKKALQEFSDLPSLSAATRGNAKAGLKALDSDEYLRTLRNMNAAEIKAIRDHDRDLFNAQVKANRDQEGEDRRHSAEVRRNDAEMEKHRLAADARERTRQNYNRMRSSRRNMLQPFDREGERYTRADRLAERHAASVRRAQAVVTSFLRDLERLDRARPRITVDTAEGVRNIQGLQEKIRSVRLSPENSIRLDVEVDPEPLQAEMKRLRAHAEAVLGTVDLDVEIQDEGIREALAEYRRQMDALDRMIARPDIALGKEADQARRELLEIRNNLVRLETGVTEVDVRADTDKAAADIYAIRAALENLRDKTVGVDITEQEALAEIAIIEAALERIDRADPDVEIDVIYDRKRFRQFASDVDGARRGIARLSTALRNSQISMADTTQAFRIFSPVLLAVATVGAPVVSTLGGVAAGLGAIVSVLPGAIGGFATLGFALGGLEEGFKTYAKAQEALQIPVDKLTEAQKGQIEEWKAQSEMLGEVTVDFITHMGTMKTEITEVQRAAREGLFPGLMEAMDELLVYKGPLSEFLESMGSQLGGIAQHWAQALTSDAAGQWFSRVARDAELYTSAIAMAIENILGGLAELTDAFRPFAREFMAWLVNSTQRFEDWAGSLAGNRKFYEFLDSIRSTLPLLGDFAKKVGELFVNLVIAVEPFTIAIMDAVNAGLDFINALDPKVLSGILGAVGGLAAGLMVLSGVMAGVGAAAAVVSAMTGSLFTQLAAALGSFILINSTAIGAMAASGETTTLLGDAAAHAGSALAGLADFGRDAWGVIGDLLNAIEPLLPVFAEFLATTLDLVVALGGGFLDAVGLVINLVAGLVDTFMLLDENTQNILITIGLAAIAWSKYGDAVLGVVTSLRSAVEIGAEFLRGAVGPSGLQGGLQNLGDTADVAAAKADKFKGSVRGIATATLAVGAVIALSEAAKLINKNFEPAVSTVDDFTASIKGMTTTAEGAKGVLDAVFQSDDGGAIGSFADNWATFGVGAVDDFASAMEVMADKTGSLGGRFSELNSETNTLFGLLGDTKWDAVRGQLDGLDDSLASLVGTDFESAAEGFAMLSDQMEEAGISQEKILYHFSDYREELENTATQLGVTKLTEEDYYNWMRGEVPRSIQEAVDAQGVQQEGLAGVADKTGEAEQATRELIDAQDELSGRFLSQEEANLRYFEVLDQFNEHMATATKTLDVQTEAGRENREWFIKMADATRSKAEADLEATGDVGAFTETMWDQREALIELAEKFGMNEDEASDYANTLLNIPPDVDTRAELHDYASERARGIQDELDDIERKIKITVEITKNDPFGIWKPGKGPNAPGPWADGYRAGHDGFVLEPMARGGLRPMSPIAQMVKPDTWRVVGDRMDVDEAYIPLDGSKRSKDILLETMLRMPGMFMHDGGIVAFAGGAVASSGAAAPGAEGATDATMAPVAEAFAALEAALREGYAALMADLLGMSQAFFEELLAAIIAFQAAETEASTLWRESTLEATRAHLDGALSAMQVHISAMTGASTLYRDSETAATSTYLSDLQSLNVTAQSQMTGAWSGTYDMMGDIAGRFRSTQYSEFDGFYGALTDQIVRFGTDADFEWGRIWNGLVDSADSIFGKLPGKVGSRLAEINRKMNENIVNPFNKIVKDMDLDGDLKLSPFPTQSHATGGHVALRTGGFMPGYTPGRDVHTFVSPTGGVLELSGGEPVLRPEAGVVLGRKWVDDVNAAARNGGVNGVRQYLTQGYASGGMTSFPDIPTMSFASGGMIPRTTAGIVKLGRMLQALGVRVGEHPAFGRVGRHAPGSWHYRAGALDLNTAAGESAGEKAYFDELAPILHQLGWGVIWRYPNHYGHLHVDIGNRSLGNWNRAGVKRDGSLWDALKGMRVEGGAGGGFGFIDLPGEMKSWIEKSRKETSKLGRLGGFSGGIADQVFSALAEEKADEFYSFDMGSPSGGSGGSGVERWRGAVVKALEFMGQPTSKAMQDITLRRMNQESSGNPRAINLWDINAKRGDPSKGLMQVIGSTFRAHARAPYNKDIWDPLSNIIASMSWALHRYGSLPAAYNRAGGYADGGFIDLPGMDLNPEVLFRDGGGNLPTGFSLVHNNLAHEETILPHTTAEVTDAFRRIEDMDMARTVDQSVNFPNARFEADPDMVADSIERKRRVAAIQRPMKF